MNTPNTLSNGSSRYEQPYLPAYISVESSRDDEWVKLFEQIVSDGISRVSKLLNSKKEKSDRKDGHVNIYSVTGHEQFGKINIEYSSVNSSFNQPVEIAVISNSIFQVELTKAEDIQSGNENFRIETSHQDIDGNWEVISKVEIVGGVATQDVRIFSSQYKEQPKYPKEPEDELIKSDTQRSLDIAQKLVSELPDQ